MGSKSIGRTLLPLPVTDGDGYKQVNMSSNIEQVKVSIDGSNGLDIGAIESHLKSLWREDSCEGESEGAAVTRARVLNLLVYVDSMDQAAALDSILTETTRRHPARAMVMIVDHSDAKPEIQAWVSARCQVHGDDKQVCCEQITFHAKGDTVRELPSAINPLLAPDLPVFLWWRAVPNLSDPVFSRLMDMSDRVVINSGDFAHPRRDMVTLSQVLKQKSAWVGISDFNWARLTTWRTLFASFYNVPDYRPYLDRVNELHIEYAPPSSGDGDISTRAILLAGWLANCLGWEIDRDASANGGDGNRFLFKTKDKTITVRFIPVERAPDMSGWIARATLGVTGDHGASFSVERSPDTRRLVTEVVIEGEKQPVKVIGYKDATEAELLGGELSLLDNDHVYQTVVNVAGQIAEVNLHQK